MKRVLSCEAGRLRDGHSGESTGSAGDHCVIWRSYLSTNIGIDIASDSEAEEIYCTCTSCFPSLSHVKDGPFRVGKNHLSGSDGACDQSRWRCRPKVLLLSTKVQVAQSHDSKKRGGRCMAKERIGSAPSFAPLTNCFASTITLEPLCLHAGNDVLPRLLP